MEKDEPQPAGRAEAVAQPAATVELHGQRVGFASIGRARRAAWASAGFFGALTIFAPAIAGGLLYVAAPAFVLALGALVTISGRDPDALRFARGPGVVRIGRDASSSSLDDASVAIEVGGRRRVYRQGDILEGWLDPLAEGVVVLRMADGDVAVFDAEGEAQAQSILAHLGLSAAQRTVRVRLASAASQHRFGRVIAVACLLLLSACGLTNALSLATRGLSTLLRDGPGGIAMLLVALPMTLLVLAGVSLAAQYLARPTAVIGADGLDVRGFLRRRFTPLRDVRDVTFDGRRVRLDLEGDRVLELAPASNHAGVLLQARLLAALREARSGVAAAKTELLDRAGASLEAWRARLAELKGSSGYRDVRFDRDDLLSALEDVHGPRERRVAAAFSLSDDSVARPRLRVAIEGCADEALREALERAAEGDLEIDPPPPHIASLAEPRPRRA